MNRSDLILDHVQNILHQHNNQDSNHCFGPGQSQERNIKKFKSPGSNATADIISQIGSN